MNAVSPIPAARLAAPEVEPAPAPPTVLPKRQTLRLAALALLLAGLAAGIWFLRDARTAVTPPVMTAPVVRGTVEQAVLATGILKPSHLVAVGAQVSGRVTRLAVSLGQTVKTGDLIAEIDSEPQRNALARAEAGLAATRAQETEKQATLALQQRTLTRQQTLVERKAISEVDLETAQSDVAVTQAQIAALDAEIASAEVAVDSARADLGYTRVTAPSDGTVLAVVAQEGQTLNVNQSTPTIVVIGDLATMSIHAEISEADVVGAQPGQQVYFTILGDPGHKYRATLDSIAPAPSSINNDLSLTGSGTTGSAAASEAIYYDGIFTVPNPDGRLKTYMTAEVHIVQGRAEDVPTIPAAALGATNPDGTRTVKVLTPAGTTELRQVMVGLDDRTLAEIRSGLAVGETVVTGQKLGSSSSTATAPRRIGPPMGL